ncbi:hypothetical protein [Croceibacterium aestuarii]|uniref:hypothetical protein n=1 Tax=Croceibacterium aestuarii TaxID=3064139 RepID=UPI00272ED339|nr:hypothetical protein [Croceibacterium sp. D39]
MRKVIAALLLAGATVPAVAHDPAMNSSPTVACDRACLYRHADAYLDALVKQDPARLPWADHVIFTDNNVQLEVGDGTWDTVDGRRGYDLKFADPKSGEVSWFGVIEEHGVPAIMALRLKIEHGKIAQAEQIVTRKVENSPFPSIDTYVTPRKIMLDDVPASKRTSRERMIALADGYFNTIEQNDGTILTKFSPDCDRIENGLQTTRNEAAFPNYPIAKYGCQKQFELGQYRYDDRLRERRFPLVDEQKGIVVTGGFIDHKGKLVNFTWTDGKTPVHSFYTFPHSYYLMEAFKIVDGEIAAVEAVFIDVPYHMRSPFGKEGK